MRHLIHRSQVLSHMRRQQIVANVMTFSAAISACVESSWPYALHLLDEMEIRHLEPDVVP